MSALRSILKKKNRIDEHDNVVTSRHLAPATEFRFVRTTTDQQEDVYPPDHPAAAQHYPNCQFASSGREFAFRTSANAEFTDDPTAQRHSAQAAETKPPREHRLSRLLHRGGRSRAKSDVDSSNLPDDLGDAPPLPSISVTGTGDNDARLAQEAQWEKRATILASSSSSLLHGDASSQRSNRSSNHSRSRSPSISDARSDVNIQEAIRLHEAGDLIASTRMFGRLADPNGDNNALAQVLYGLALRHGWGVEVDSANAVDYLSMAAKNAAGIEQQALAAGISKGGAAKGELVLAIFELANCLRNGWGVKKDPVAARHYYETAANLGDTDAMDQAAQCYMDGVGGPKDKFKAAQYLRLAEKSGTKTVGNSWIWKEKYDPKPGS